jgi:hypothetical protein
MASAAANIGAVQADSLALEFVDMEIPGIKPDLPTPRFSRQLDDRQLKAVLGLRLLGPVRYRSVVRNPLKLDLVRRSPPVIDGPDSSGDTAVGIGAERPGLGVAAVEGDAKVLDGDGSDSQPCPRSLGAV